MPSCVCVFWIGPQARTSLCRKKELFSPPSRAPLLQNLIKVWNFVTDWSLYITWPTPRVPSQYFSKTSTYFIHCKGFGRLLSPFYLTPSNLPCIYWIVDGLWKANLRMKNPKGFIVSMRSMLSDEHSTDWKFCQRKAKDRRRKAKGQRENNWWEQFL